MATSGRARVFITEPQSLIGAYTVAAFLQAGFRVHALLRVADDSSRASIRRRLPKYTAYGVHWYPIPRNPTLQHKTEAYSRAVSNVDAVVYTGTHGSRIVRWEDFETPKLLFSAASAKKPFVSRPVKSFVFHTPPNPLAQATSARISQAPRIWNPRRVRFWDPEGKAEPPFPVTNICAPLAHGPEPFLNPGIYPSPHPRHRHEYLFPQHLYNHHWVDARDLATLFLRAVQKDLDEADPTKPSYLPRRWHPFRAYVAAPGPISASSRSKISDILRLYHPDHKDIDPPSNHLSPPHPLHATRARELLGREWTAPEQTVFDCLNRTRRPRIENEADLLAVRALEDQYLNREDHGNYRKFSSPLYRRLPRYQRTKTEQSVTPALFRKYVWSGGSPDISMRKIFFRPANPELSLPNRMSRMRRGSWKQPRLKSAEAFEAWMRVLNSGLWEARPNAADDAPTPSLKDLLSEGVSDEEEGLPEKPKSAFRVRDKLGKLVTRKSKAARKIKWTDLEQELVAATGESGMPSGLRAQFKSVSQMIAASRFAKEDARQKKLEDQRLGVTATPSQVVDSDRYVFAQASRAALKASFGSSRKTSPGKVTWEEDATTSVGKTFTPEAKAKEATTVSTSQIKSKKHTKGGITSSSPKKRKKAVGKVSKDEDAAETAVTQPSPEPEKDASNKPEALDAIAKASDDIPPKQKESTTSETAAPEKNPSQGLRNQSTMKILDAFDTWDKALGSTAIPRKTVSPKKTPLGKTTMRRDENTDITIPQVGGGAPPQPQALAHQLGGNGRKPQASSSFDAWETVLESIAAQDEADLAKNKGATRDSKEVVGENLVPEQSIAALEDIEAMLMTAKGGTSRPTLARGRRRRRLSSRR